MAKKGGHTPNEMRSRSMNQKDVWGKASAENHRVQTSGHTPNDMRSIDKNSNNIRYHKAAQNRANQLKSKQNYLEASLKLSGVFLYISDYLVQ